MTRRVARFLIHLYPLSWRARYGAEFEAFLIQENAGIREVVDVACCAVREHLFLFGELTMTNLQRSVVWMAYSCLAAILAGMNVWWTVDDTPLVHAVRDSSVRTRQYALEQASHRASMLTVPAG
jgi:hypothetical protein